jgi:hypothetical protein
MDSEIFNFVGRIPIIDTHEHLPPFEKDRARTDVFGEYLFHYFSVDLVSAGLSVDQLETVRHSDLPVMQKWQIVEPYWEAARYTGYGQCLDRSVKTLYNINGIHKGTIEALNSAFLKTYENKNWFGHVLKDIANIRVSILDADALIPADPAFFKSAHRINELVHDFLPAKWGPLEKRTGIRIGCFEDYLSACAKSMDAFARNSGILKCSLAYERTLDFEYASEEQAKKGFDQILDAYKAEKPIPYFKPLEDFIFHFLLGIAQEKQMVLQIHTGIQEGNGNTLLNSSPIHLNPLFGKYPKVTFDVFHIGYPYQQELGVLCKMYPNVFVNMCWAHIISPVQAKATLSEWLELIPYTKIAGFGGDFCLIDGVCGHAEMARDHVAQVLSDKVEQKLFTTDTAKKIAQAVLHDNPARIYKIGC